MKQNTRLFLSALLLTIGMTAAAQPKATYYSSADGKTKESLKIALGKIVKNHTKRSYDQLKTDYKKVYVVPGTTQQVWDIFSDEVYNYSQTSKWNREHVVANSWWGGTKNNAYSDLLSVIPSEVMANNHKSNFPPAELTGNVKYDHGHIRVGTPKSGLGGSYNNAFEPIDSLKGDFARIYFYVATCYDDIAWGSGNVKSEIKRETWPTLNPWLYKMLLRWHNLDPVSSMEIQINNDAEGIQGNRNPFIDYPVLADYIWNEEYFTTAFDLSSAVLYQHISGEIPPTPPTPPTPPDTIPTPPTPPTPPSPDSELVPGELYFADYFDSIEKGEDDNTGGSSNVWEGDDDFVNVVAAYQAGGAVRLGTGKKQGSLYSRQIDCGNSTNLYVELDIKGWSDADAKVAITIGDVTQNVTSTNRMSDGYEHISILFKDVTNPDVLEITTSSDSKRCFIDNVEVKAAVSALVLGDVDGNGEINVSDIALLASYILGNDPDGFVSAAADFNADGSIDVGDISSVAAYILANEAAEAFRRLW